MKAKTIKNYFSGTLFITAILMSTYSCAGISSYESRDHYQLFAVQSESHNVTQNNSDTGKAGCKSQSKNSRKEVSWGEWFSSSNRFDLHFLNLLELIGASL